MKKILWGILILVALIVSGCGAGGKVNNAPTDSGGGGSTDATPLAVVSTIPINNTSGVTASETFSFIFNKEIDVATVVPSSFSVSCGDSTSNQSPLTEFAVAYDSASKAVKLTPTGGWPLAQVCVVTAKAGNLKDTSDLSLSSPASYSFTTTGNSGTGLDETLTLSPTGIVLVADSTSTSTLTARLTNVGGVPGPATGKTLTFTPSLGSITAPVDANPAMAGWQVVTDSAGEATITYKAGNATGTGGVSVTYGVLQAASAIYLNPGDVSTLDVAFSQASPNPSGPLGVVSTKETTLYARVTDGSNLLVDYTVSFILSDNKSGAKLSDTSGGAKLSAISVKTDSSGWAKVTYTAGIVSSAVTDTVTVTAGSQSKALALTVSPQRVGSVTITSPASDLYADGYSTTFLTIEILDTDEAPAASKTITVTSTLGTIITPDAYPSTPGLQVITNALGKAKVAYQAGTLAGKGSLIADCEGMIANTPILLLAGDPSTLEVSFDLINFAPAAQNLVSGRQMPLYARVKDAYGNLVPGATVNFTFTGNQNKSGATLNQASAVTDSAGVATVTYTAGKIAATPTPDADTVTITVNSLLKTLDINVLQQPVGSVTLTGSESLTADGADPATPLTNRGSYTAVVKDISGNLLKGQVVTFYSVGGGSFVDVISGVAVANTVTTNELGEATIGYKAPATLGSVTLYAMAGIKRSAVVSTKVVSGPPATIRLLPKDSLVGPAGTTSIEAQVVDVLGYPVVAGTPVNFDVSVDGSGVGLTYLGTKPTNDMGSVKEITYKAGLTNPAVDTIRATSGTISTTKQITVNLAAARIKSFNVTSSKTTLLANGTDYAKLTVKVLDTNDLGMAGIGVTYQIDTGSLDTNTTVGGGAATQLVTTDANGEAVVYVFSAANETGVGKVTINSTSGNYAEQNYSYVSGTPSTVTLSAGPNIIAPYGETTLTALVKDPAGNPVKGDTVTFQITTNTSVGKLSALTAVTNLHGEATVTYTAGGKTALGPFDVIKATSSNSKTGNVNVTVDPAAVIVGSVALSAEKTELVADNSATSYLTVSVLDVDGAPAVGKSVTVSALLGTIISPDADLVTAGIQVVTNASGQATIAYKAGTVTGAGSVTAVCEGLQNTVGITLVAGAPSLLDVSFDLITFNPALPQSLISGRELLLYAKVTDANGNLVPGATVSFAFTGVNNASSATLGAESASTDAAGIASITYTAGVKAPNLDTVTITTGGLIKTLQVSVLQQPVGSVSLSGSASLTADGADANVLASRGSYTAVVKDISGNLLKNQVVTFYFIGGGSFVDAVTGAAVANTVTTDDLGEATIAYKAPAALGNVTLYAMAGIKRSTDVTTTVVNGPPASIRLFPMDTQVGPAGTTDIVAQVVDALGFPVPNQTVNLEVSTNNSGVILPFLGAPVTDALGQVQVSTYKAGITPAFDTIQAKSGTVSTTKQIQVTVTASRIKEFSVTTTRESLVADGVDNAKLTVKVLDNNNLGVAGISIGFTIDSGLLDLDPTVVGGTATTQTVVTGTNGEAVVFVVAPLNALGNGRVTIKAASGDYAEQNYSYVAGTPATVTLNAAPSTIAPYGESILTAIIKDAAGNPVSGDLVTFQVVTNTSGGKLSDLTATTDIHGEASVTYTAGRTIAIATPDTIKASSSNAKSGIRNIVVDPTAIIIGNVSLAVDKTELIADGLNTSVLIATVLDIEGNPAVGQTVTFSEALSGGAVAGVKVPAGMSVVTDAKGQAKLTYTAGKKIGLVQLTATCTGVGSTVEITLNPGAPAQLDVSFDNSNLNPAGALSLVSGKQTNLYARVLDANGNPVRMAEVIFSMSLPQDHPSYGWFTCENGTPGNPDDPLDICDQYTTKDFTAVSDATPMGNETGGFGSGNGVATAIYTAGETSNVTDTITVTVGGLTQTFTKTLKVNVQPRVAAMTLTYNDKVTAAPPVVAGSQEIKIYARAFADAGKTIPAANVDVAASFPLVDDNKSGATLSFLTGKTDGDGYIIFTYTAGVVTSPVSDRVAISSGGFEADATISVVAKVASITITYGDLVTAVAPNLVAGQTLTIYAKVMDGNTPAKAVAGISVDFGFPINGDNQSGASFSPTSAITDANGVAVATLTAGPTKTAVTDTLTVTAGGYSQTGTIPVKPAVASIKLYYNDLATAAPVAPGTILTGSGASTLVFAQVLDGIGDPVAGVTVNFAFNVGKNLSGATVTPATAVTDVNGFASATFKAGSISGVDDELYVSAGTVSTTALFKVDPVVGTISFDKTEIIVDSSSTDTLTFILRDQLGNTMGNTAFAVIPGGSVNPSVLSGNTLADGSYTLSIDDLANENTSITITAGGQSETIPVYAGATLELTPATANAPADGVTNLTYTANLRDYAGVVLQGLPIRFSGFNKVILSTGLATTDANGNASVNLRSTIFTPTDATKEITAQAGALTTDADAIFEPGPAKTIALSVPAAANPLSLGGSTTITAVISDALGNPVKSGTVINFVLDGSIGSVTGQAVTADATGTVAVPFQGGMKSGNVTVTATSGDASSTLNLTIKPSDAGIIELKEIDPLSKMINIRGSGTTQSAIIKFIVKDGAGNPVADGTVVNFTLPIATAATVAAGGEAIATTTLFAEAVNGTTVDGVASVTLRSGKMARTVGVTATVTVGATTISTEARVTIVGGKPDSRHISIATERHNVAGGVTYGLQNKITAFLGDRFSNIPLDGTPVSFYSECGTIGDSTGFTLSSIGGQVVASMTTQNPTTPNLAGVGGTGNVGMCTVLAAMPGEEYYDDFNGDGVYDAADGDVCSGDLGEPYIDGNDSGAYELGEFFVDINDDKVRNGADGNCSSSTMIWTDIRVMMSATAAPLNVTPVYFAIPVGDYQEFNLNLSDIFGNAPVAGTKLTISADGGTLGGLIDYTVPDYAGYGNWYSEDSNGDGTMDIGLDIDGDGNLDPGVPIRFWLSADTKADAEPKAVKITITRTPAAASSAGTDGLIQKQTISGTINTPASWSRMSVRTDAYTLSAGTGTANVTATLNDALGNPVQGVTVNFNTEPAGVQYGTFAPASDVTDANGEAHAVYTAGSVVGVINLKASDAGVNHVGATAISVTPATANKITLTLSKSSVTTGGVVTASALVQDAFNNPVADQTVTFGFAPLGDQTGGSFDSPASATTNSFGIATINYTAGSNLSLSTETDTLRASVGAINGDAALSVTTPTDAAKKITMILGTSTMTANGTDTTTATAYVSDSATAAGKPVQGVEVNFTTTLGNIVGSAFTDAAGMATATLTADTVPGSGTVQASVGVLSATDDFTLIPGPAATISNVVATPATVKPSGSTTISARVVDANGNAVADGTFVSFSAANLSGGYLLSTSDSTVSGNVSVVYKAGNTSATDVITISSGTAPSVPTNVVVNSGLNSIDAMTISAAAAVLRNNGTDSTVITATVTKGGVPVEGIDISFANAGVAGSLFTTGGAAYAAPIFTDENGQAQIVFKSGTVQGTATVTATFGAFSQDAVLSIVDKVANVTLTVDKDQIAADGATTTNVTATVTDLLGVPLSGVTVNLATTRGILSAGPYVTNAAGQVTATLTSTTMLGTALVTASYSTLSDTMPVQFVVGPPANITLTGSPTILPHGGQSSLVVSVTDSQKRPVPNANLYFGYNPSVVAGNLSGGNFSLTTGTTDAQGRLTLSYTAGNVTATDTLLVETEVAGVDATLAMVVDPTTADVGSMILSAPTLASVVANGVTTTQMTATVIDSLGAPMAGVPVSFATTYGDIDPVNGGVQTSIIKNTSVSGQATVTLTSATTIGKAFVTAATGGLLEQQSVEFVPGLPDAGNSSLTPLNSSLPADNASSTEVRAVLKDANDNPVADGTNVTLLSTLGTIASNPVTTTNGVAIFTVTATRTTGTADLSVASVPGLTASMTFGANSGANIGAMTLTAVTSNLTVAGAGQPASTTITLQAVESDGVAIDESFWGANNTIRVEFVSHPGGSEFIAGIGGVCSDSALTTEATCVAPATWSGGKNVSTATGYIDVRTVNGTATVTLQAGTLPGVIQLKATALDETGAPTTVTASLPNISVAAGPPHTIVLIPGTTTAGAATTTRAGTIIATDRFGNAVPNETVLNLGLVDTVLATGAANASTNNSTLSGGFVDNLVRAIQPNDRVLITNAAAVDQSRFVATGTASPFTVTQNYNNVVVGSLQVYIGASLQGGFVSSNAGDIGQVKTTGGVGTIKVTYPTSLTTANAGVGYGCAAVGGSEEVFMVVTSQEGGVSAINQAGFCFAP